MKLPRALNAPLFSGRIRSVPEDFVVEELPAFEATGEGEHLLLSIRKHGMNTAFCAQNIARWVGIEPSQVVLISEYTGGGFGSKGLGSVTMAMLVSTMGM